MRRHVEQRSLYASLLLFHQLHHHRIASSNECNDEFDLRASMHLYAQLLIGRRFSYVLHRIGLNPSEKNTEVCCTNVQHS